MKLCRLLFISLWVVAGGNPVLTSSGQDILDGTKRELTPVTWDVISYDNFEIGSWGNYRSGGSEALLESSGVFNSRFTSTTSAIVRDDILPPKTSSTFVHTYAYDVTAYDDLNINFFYYTESMTSGKHKFFVEYSNDNTNWRTVDLISTFRNKVPLERTVSFSAAAIDVASMSLIKIRFRCQGKDRTTRVLVDNIRFEGRVALAATPTVPSPTVPPAVTSPPVPPVIFPPPVAPMSGAAVCPIDRLYPPSKYEILPFSPFTMSPAFVEDDLSEVSSLAFSDQTDAEGNVYAYAASDKNQYSLKVIRFARQSSNGKVIQSSATTVAFYTLDVHFSNSDWEDISLGPCSGSSTAETCIYIGDFGNNARASPDPYVQRTVMRILKFPEPRFQGSTPASLSRVPVTTIFYRYASPGWKTTTFYDAEAMFVDWVGSGKGDIYIITKGTCTLGGVGMIPASYHGSLPVGNVPSNIYMPTNAAVYSMARVITEPPKQGSTGTCNNVDYKPFQGADMRRDGQLIAMIAGGSPPRVYFYPRVNGETVIDALTSPTGASASCSYIASTSYGLANEKKHEAVAFLPDGRSYAETSECDGGRACNVPIYFWDLVFPSSSPTSLRNGPIPTDGWEFMSFENFETGTLGIFSNGAQASASSTYACSDGGASSVWSAYISGHDGAASSIAHQTNQFATNFSWLKVQFDFLLDGFDHMDTFFVEVSLDSGGTYFIVADWALGTKAISLLQTCYRSNTVVLNSNNFGVSRFGPEVRVRFRTSANLSTDSVYIDNILLLGHV
jgi:hypothetical protein